MKGTDVLRPAAFAAALALILPMAFFAGEKPDYPPTKVEIVADDTTMLHALVLAAIAFIVLGGAEYFCTEKTVALRFKRPVINRFRLLDLATGPLQNLFGRCKRYSNTRVKLWVFRLGKKIV